MLSADEFTKKLGSLLKSGALTAERFLSGVIRESRQLNVEPDSFPEKDRYIFLSKHLHVADIAARKALGDDSTEAKKIGQLQKSVARLDDECGTDIHLVPGTPREVQNKQIAELDNDKVKFALILKEELPKNEGAFEAFLIEYARLVYRFNEYQAPFRTSGHQAMLDAMGLSDHFSELLDNIRKELSKEKSSAEKKDKDEKA